MMPARRRRPTAARARFSPEALWEALKAHRGGVDVARYKQLVLELVFLKYVSDAFAQRRETVDAELVAEGIGDRERKTLLDDIDEYRSVGVFWISDNARWDFIVASAKVHGPGGATIGKVLDAAVKAITETNAELKGALAEGIFSSRDISDRWLAQLVDLVNGIGFHGEDVDASSEDSGDLLGETFRYCVDEFAIEEGKPAELSTTPQSIAKLMIAVLDPRTNERIYDPACGTGGIFIEAARHVERAGGATSDIAVYGQDSDTVTWRLAKMNLGIHRLEADLGSRWADSFHEDQHARVSADVVFSHVPFNTSGWGAEWLTDDTRWSYGTPPSGNANFAWLQVVASKLRPHGRAGVVLANGSLSSRQSGEGNIRQKMIEDDLVSCIVGLPGNMFRSSGIPACLWFLAKDKSPTKFGGNADRRGQMLFIDARNLGRLITRTLRVFDADDVDRIAHTFGA